MKHSKAALFLMELILALLFFALASTVCIRLFTKAHALSRQTVNENHAVIHAQNLAEAFLSTEGNMEDITALFPNADFGESDNVLMLFFDENWNVCSLSEAYFHASITILPATDGLTTANIAVTSLAEPSNTIYSLMVTHHIAERRGNLEN